MTEWQRSTPVYAVGDVEASIAWYGNVFGFVAELVNRDPKGESPPNYAVLWRDGVALHLVRQAEVERWPTSPAQTQFVIDAGLDQLFEEVKAKGASILQTPDDRPWGHRDFMVADPDGNVVWMSQRLAP